MHCASSARLLLPLSSCVTRSELTTPKSFSRGSILTCRAVHASSSITDFDLYDLLGIDSCSDQSQIKLAYRSLQKRCHPDIAGPAGHQMAIILNEAYAVLSDPNSRFAYDKEQKKIAEFTGFIMGRPMYSVWFGSESEQRAIFVDEIKCVGCLKCALLAEKTFAIESVYGRARVVGQWADPEEKIQEAIDSCPVNCISVVERSNLAALEFLMSKQPRGNVRVGAGNTIGARVSNIFTDVQKFQTRFQEAMEKASIRSSKVIDPQREARMSAIQAIRSISNWLYWRAPVASGASSGPDKSLTRIAYRLPKPNIDKLREAAARKQLSENKRAKCDKSSEEYWAPSAYALPPSTENTATPRSAAKPSSSTVEQIEANERESEIYDNQNNPIRWAFPMVTAMIAVATVRLHGGGSVPELSQHAGGSLALDIVNSPWSQCILAAATWYMIGLAIIDLVAIVGRKK